MGEASSVDTIPFPVRRAVQSINSTKCFPRGLSHALVLRTRWDMWFGRSTERERKADPRTPLTGKPYVNNT